MPDRDSNFANAFETTLTSAMGATDLTATVATTAGGPTSPCYLVIEPGNADRREYAYFDGTFTGTTFVTTLLANRYLDGSAAGSGIEHPSGSAVVQVPAAQMFEDVHDRIDADASAFATHESAFTSHTADVDAHHTRDHASRHATGGADEITELATATSALGQVSRRLYRATGTQSLPHNAATTLTHTTTDHDEGGLTYSSGVITIPVGGAGLYAVSAGVAITGSGGTAFLGLILVVNAVNVAQNKLFAHNSMPDFRINVATTVLLADGDTLESRLHNVQASGSSAVDAVAATQQTFLAATRIPSVT